MTPSVGFAGMTHLGLVSATATAARGLPVLCVDPDEALIQRLGEHELPVFEPGLREMLDANGPAQKFSAVFSDLGACDVVYIAPDVPTDNDGGSDLGGIAGLIERVIPHLSETAILVILCQVPPGFTRALAFDKDRLFYQVETLVFGQAVERAARPERFILGCAEPARALPDAYRAVLAAFDCPVLPMRFESAELAKISINMCLVASISVANTMAEVCESVGADWGEIVPALRLDRRIGQHSYLKPGLGIAGGNLERDLATVVRLGEEHGCDSGVVQAWIANSRHRRDWAHRTLQETVLTKISDPLVAVWGLAYKENTRSVKNSPALATLAKIPETRVRLHDPAVEPQSVHHPRSETAPDKMAALQDADALMILTPWPEYRDVAPAALAARMQGRVVIDPYRVLEPAKMAVAGLSHHVLGLAPAS